MFSILQKIIKKRKLMSIFARIVSKNSLFGPPVVAERVLRNGFVRHSVHPGVFLELDN